MQRGTAIASFGAAVLGLGVATGFIHKAEPKTPDQCFDDYIKATAPLVINAAPVLQDSAITVVETRDMLQQRVMYADCMHTYSESSQGFTVGFGWK